jgi:N-terminal acetyltransferase B complex catalytic subunit
MGLATMLTRELEEAGDEKEAWFVDLYVRVENESAWKGLYGGMGYSVFRKVEGYYNDDADAFDMRKPLSRDRERLHVREHGERFVVQPADVW